MLGVRELAAVSGFTEPQIRLLAKKGIIPALREGRRIVFDEAVLPTLKELERRSRVQRLDLRISRKRAMEILQSDDAVVIDDRERQMKHDLPPHVNPKRPLRNAIITLRYARITPSYVVALCAYLHVEVCRFMQVIGLSYNYWQRFHKTYSPHRAQGFQVQFQCGMFWIVKLLYAEGLIPYGFARLGGILDPQQEEKELLCLRHLREDGTEVPTKQGDGKTAEGAWGKQLSPDTRSEWL